MRIRHAIVGLGIVANGLAVAHAQDRPVSRLATVDPSGRVVPVWTATRPKAERVADTPPCAVDKPLPLEEARALVARIAREEDFYPDFVISVAKAESRFNSVATSEKGAFGLMQLMPATARRLRVDLCDPAGNVRGGVRLLRALHEKYRNPFYILAAYHAGEHAVAKSHGVPAIAETVRYVAEVINDFYALPAPGRSAGGKFTTSTSASAAWNDGFVMHID
ncbi:MAG: lytic transglycosylase domain-containing protein [Bosea sp. (in: a-proteobacteria)]|uniref:lytic transglycosylase domain-containing protein n=1 Tax=Bosea sp. (in: a-proteobacteria) TaxID=1871050 RepID=UPI003F7B8903